VQPGLVALPHRTPGFDLDASAKLLDENIVGRVHWLIATALPKRCAQVDDCNGRRGVEAVCAPWGLERHVHDGLRVEPSSVQRDSLVNDAFPHCPGWRAKMRRTGRRGAPLPFGAKGDNQGPVFERDPLDGSEEAPEQSLPGIRVT
jgi:hypothetical protein